jgi:hypothetical protein
MSNYAAGAATQKGKAMYDLPDLPFRGNRSSGDDVYHNVKIAIDSGRTRTEDHGGNADTYQSVDLEQIVRAFIYQHNFPRRVQIQLEEGEHQSDATIEFISSSPAYPLGFISGVPHYFICHRMFRDMGPENTVVAIQTGRLNLVLQAESFLQFVDGNRLDSGHEGFLRELTKLMDTHFNFAMQVNS